MLAFEDRKQGSDGEAGAEQAMPIGEVVAEEAMAALVVEPIDDDEFHEDAQDPYAETISDDVPPTIAGPVTIESQEVSPALLRRSSAYECLVDAMA